MPPVACASRPVVGFSLVRRRLKRYGKKQKMADLISTSKGYQDLLAQLKSRIQQAQIRAAVAVNRELVLLPFPAFGTGR